MIKSSIIAVAPGIRHGFFTRAGGVSGGIYAALNCGYGSNDDPAHVAENRARCAAGLGVGPDRLVTAYQIHGITVAEVDMPWAPGAGPRADALVTRRRGVALGILTADCAPVLLVDGEAGIIGAAHAGWKGAKAGVVGAVVAAMTRLGAEPSRIAASVGPAIGIASYEVGDTFRDAFVDDEPESARYFATRPHERPRFDLSAFVADRLRAQGLIQIDRIDADTCAESERFFSYRRSCKTGEPDYGRQLSAIALI